MKLLHLFAIIFAVTTASVASERRRQPPGGGQGPPGGGGGPPPPKDGPPPTNGTLNGTAPGGNGTAPSMTDSGSSSNLGIGTTTMNITSNGVDYFNVRYINETTMERVELDMGLFTIPAGCYPCVGAYWCANYLHPPPCRSDPDCDYNDEITGCEDMFASAAEKLATCSECHANGSDYCIVQNTCVEDQSSDFCVDHIITTDPALAALGLPTDCQMLEENSENSEIEMLAGTEEVKDLNIIIILSCAAGLLLFFACCCIRSYRRKDPATSFDQNMFDKYDADLGNGVDLTEEEAPPPPVNVSHNI